MIGSLKDCMDFLLFNIAQQETWDTSHLLAYEEFNSQICLL